MVAGVDCGSSEVQGMAEATGARSVHRWRLLHHHGGEPGTVCGPYYLRGPWSMTNRRWGKCARTRERGSKGELRYRDAAWGF